MGKLVINHNKITKDVAEKLVSICPFNAIEYKDNKLDINSACKLCRMCVRKGPEGAITFQEDEVKAPSINKDEWKGIAVFVELELDNVHPVVYELIGKAKELVQVTKQEVYAVLIASKEQVEKYKDEILSYGVDKLFVYENELYKNFNMDRFASAMQNFIETEKPSVVLYGGTPLGRSFAPKIASHFKTGLTADCTRLGMKENTDLIQVRPAFGGNIMAQIICTNTRPQMSTVRYKIFQKPAQSKAHGSVVYKETKNLKLDSMIKLLNIIRKERTEDISEADVIVACGRAFKSAEEMSIAYELADLLGGVVAVSRPMVEAGIKDAKYQIGLSGKTVAPKLIITLGISGAVQFVAGMSGSQLIISINKDPNASIFDVSHYGIVDDIFKVVPELIRLIKEAKGE